MKYVYTGVFFNYYELFNKFNCNIRDERLERKIMKPHVTFTYMPESVREDLFGMPTKFRVIGYACNGINQGLQVEATTMHAGLKDEYAKVKTPHITISVSTNGKPVDTGKLKFVPIENPFYIIGRYGAFDGEKVVY